MKFRISRDQFAHGLSLATGILQSKATLPVLSNVLIDATEKGEISLTMTNLDFALRLRLKAEIVKPGSTTLPVKRLQGIVRELPSVDVTMAMNNGNVTIESGSSKFRIATLPPDEFPKLPGITPTASASLDQADLSAMISLTNYAQSSDETRYILNGTHFDFAGDMLSLVATDGRRLARSMRPIGGKTKTRVIMPARAVASLARFLHSGSKVKIDFGERAIVFHIDTDKSEELGLVGSLYFSSKLVEGNYPDYRAVIPKEPAQAVELEREHFLQCLHRAALVTSEKSNSVRVCFTKGQVELKASSPDFGEAHEVISLNYTGPDLDIAFNPGFLMDPLKAITKDKVTIEVRDAASPAVIKTDDSFLCVVMPVRLS